MPMTLLASDRMEDLAIKELRQGLAKHLDLDEPRYWMRKSASEELARLIQLIASEPIWAALGVAATAYPTRLSQHATDDSWEGIRRLFRKADPATPILEVAETLAKAAGSDGNTNVVIGLNIPNNFWGTTLSLRPDGPRDISGSLAIFIMTLAALQKK